MALVFECEIDGDVIDMLASDHEEAAQKATELWDEGDSVMVRKGVTVEVKVRKKLEAEIQTFTVSAEAVVEYSARLVKG